MANKLDLIANPHLVPNRIVERGPASIKGGEGKEEKKSQLARSGGGKPVPSEGKRKEKGRKQRKEPIQLRFSTYFFQSRDLVPD